MTTTAAALRRPAPTQAHGVGIAAQPVLKWAGGKRQLLPLLRQFYPVRFGAYFEPFVGSGAVFFDLVARDQLHDQRVVLSDVNHDVIGCYEALRRDCSGVVRALHALAEGHTRDGDAHYYAVRDLRFNPRRRQLLAARQGGDVSVVYPAAVAAMLIYLNRTGFNGLFRLNRRGDFNVPAGRYESPRICDEANLRAAANTLGRPGVSVRFAPFERVLDEACTGDFVYFDPPYAPVSATARFTSYTADGFSDVDQARLQTIVIELAARGCQVLLSNSAVPVTSALYEQDPRAREVGLRAWRVPARRAINADASKRGPVAEFLVTNIAPFGLSGRASRTAVRRV